VKIILYLRAVYYRTMFMELANQQRASKQEVHNYFTAKPKWVEHQEISEEERELLQSGTFHSRSPITHFAISTIDSGAARRRGSTSGSKTEGSQRGRGEHPSTGMTRSTKPLRSDALKLATLEPELQKLQEEEDMQREATALADSTLSNELAKEEGRVEELCNAKKAAEEEVHRNLAQVDALAKAIEQRKQHLLTLKKRLFEAMKPPQAIKRS
jgi:hypothetical protein